MKVEYPEGSEPRTEAPETTTKARVQATSRRTPQVMTNENDYWRD